VFLEELITKNDYKKFISFARHCRSDLWRDTRYAAQCHCAGAGKLENAKRLGQSDLPSGDSSGAIVRMSDGKFDLKFFEPGALVPALECFDAAAKGSVESCFTTAGYHTGKYPALAFYTAVPFGPGFGEVTAWMIHGGGNAIRDEIYAQHNLKVLLCNATGPETSGWLLPSSPCR
jgi:hypothetical protein